MLSGKVGESFFERWCLRKEQKAVRESVVQVPGEQFWGAGEAGTKIPRWACTLVFMDGQKDSVTGAE